ncbi:hypothetical protein [Microbacterium sp.]|uniref:hypothetical protein n=1 Tax=Microbacterium sp. TaxID=51671 RepID=UPI0032420B94
MSHIDKITYLACRTIDANARNDHDEYLAIRRDLEAGGYDFFEVANVLAGTVLNLMKSAPDWREQLDAMLASTKLFAEADLPNEGDEYEHENPEKP